MVDKHDGLRHGREEPSTFGSRASLHATSSSSPHRRHDSPSDASLPSSSRGCQVSPVPPPTNDVVILVSPPVPPHIDDVVDPMPPPEGEAVTDVEPESFEGGPVDLSLLPLYPDHTTRHIWDGEERGLQKFLNHGRKIVALPQPNEEWFHPVLSLSVLKNLCMTGYTMVNHKILNAFAETWHSESSSFYLLHDEMFITLDNVSCLLHLLIRGIFLDHGRMTKDEALEVMVEYLGDDLGEAMDELDKTRGAHARFIRKKVYEDALLSAQHADGDDEEVAFYRS
ncbi:protein MAIN-LIKE 1-like [Lathyrus oleraceus]|uniref:protein MAIN-LIKE 1-like n=1 Tax=Pisum sativum TaxID=3888 RepID=UPI0021D08532|nr:protein MAIN-LIKE 1-like [Pisum sativum]